MKMKDKDNQDEQTVSTKYEQIEKNRIVTLLNTIYEAKEEIRAADTYHSFHIYPYPSDYSHKDVVGKWHTGGTVVLYEKIMQWYISKRRSEIEDAKSELEQLGIWVQVDSLCGEDRFNADTMPNREERD